MHTTDKTVHGCPEMEDSTLSETDYCHTPSTARRPHGSLSFQDAIASNRRASFLLTAVLISIALAFGLAIGKVQGHPLSGILFTVTILSILAIVAMTRGKDIPLLVNGASRADGNTERLVVNIIEELKLASGLTETPEIYLLNDESINAFASAISEREAAIAVTKGAITALTREELQGVLAHEMAHILSRDSRYFVLLSVMAGSVVMISDLFLKIGLLSRKTRLSYGWVIPAIFLALFSPLVISLLRFGISRKREFLADARAVEITRNPGALASALQKAYRQGSLVRRVNRATRHMFTLNPQGSSTGKGVLFSTHPPLKERIERVQKMGARFSQ